MAKKTIKRNEIMQAINGIIAAGALMLALLVVPNDATAISSATGDEPWGEFSFDAPVGNFAADCISIICTTSDGNNSFFLGTPPWTYSGSGFLIVQDAFDIGDQFKVFDNGIEIGDTSVPIGSGDCGSDPDICFGNDNVSKGIFSLAPGDHSFTIQLIASPFIGGAGFLCVSTTNRGCSPVAVPAPEPSSMLLLGIALVGALCWSRREQLSKCYVVLSRKRRRL
jgi:hypothetical protein